MPGTPSYRDVYSYVNLFLCQSLIQEWPWDAFGTTEIGEERFSALFRVVFKANFLSPSALISVKAIYPLILSLGIKIIPWGKINIYNSDETHWNCIQPHTSRYTSRLDVLLLKPIWDLFFCICSWKHHNWFSKHEITRWEASATPLLSLWPSYHFSNTQLCAELCPLEIYMLKS